MAEPLEFAIPLACQVAGCRVGAVKGDADPGYWVQHNNTSTRLDTLADAPSWLDVQHVADTASESEAIAGVVF